MADFFFEVGQIDVEDIYQILSCKNKKQILIASF